MGSAKRKVPSGRGRGRPPKVRRGSKASAPTSSSSLAASKSYSTLTTDIWLSLQLQAETQLAPKSVDVPVAGANVKHLEDPAEKSVEDFGITSGNELGTNSESQIQLQNEEEDDAEFGGGDGNGDVDEVVTTNSTPVVKRGRGRPKKSTDKARPDDDNTSKPNGAPQITQILQDEDEDDSKIWGIESHKRSSEIHRTASSPSKNIAKRGRGRPKTLNEVNAVIEHFSNPDSSTKRGRGRPRKSDSNVAVDRTAARPSNTSNQSHSGGSRNSNATMTLDQETASLPSASSLRRSGRPKKAFVLEVTVTKGQQQVYRSVTRKDDSATEDTDKETEKQEKKIEGTGLDEGNTRDQKEPEAKRYDVHKASPTSAKVGTKRMRDGPKVQKNLVDSLSSTHKPVLKPATLRDFNRPREADMNMSSSAFDPLLGTPLPTENDFTAEEYATHASTKRPRLLPAPEFTASVTRPNMETPTTSVQTPSQLATAYHGTGMDGSQITHEEHAAMGLAYTAVQDLRDVHENFLGAETSPGLQLTAVDGQNPAQPSQPTQSPRGPSNLANRINDHYIEPPGGVFFTRSTVLVFGGASEPGDGVPDAPGSALEGSRFSVPTDIVPLSRVANTDAGSYYSINRVSSVAPVAPMLMEDQ
ncbi:hypothetical protein MMC27_006218 [Xylographa pallens]|nr:hypothetical protein [Xylographa pallens]